MKDKDILTIKGVAIIGVVLHHISNRRFSVDVRDQIAVILAIFSWCVLAFFATAGWLHALGEERGVKNIWEFASSRARRLLVPFIILVIFYAAIWQSIALLGVPGLRSNMPNSLLGKIWASIPPIHGWQAGEQLYFLPLLFLICVAVHIILRAGGIGGLAVYFCLLLVTGIVWFADSSDKGFSAGVFVWGSLSYVGGFLIRRYRENPVLLPTAIGLFICLGLTTGVSGWVKAVPILLLVIAPLLRFGHIPILPVIGEASGTIYVYHTPFILQPLVITVAHLPSEVLQVWGAILACLISISTCIAFFYCFRTTRAKSLLL